MGLFSREAGKEAVAVKGQRQRPEGAGTQGVWWRWAGPNL